MFKVGQEVWVLNYPCKPLKAVVVTAHEIIGYSCTFPKGWEFLNKRTFMEYELFDDPEKLMSTLRDVIDDLESFCDKLERSLPDGN